MPADPLADLDRLLTRAQLGNLRQLGEARADLLSLAAQLHALIELAVEKGFLSKSDLSAKIDNIYARLSATDPSPAAAVVLASSDPPPPDPAIDCEARLPLCRAVCCSMEVPLTVAEVESAAVRWDLSRPYHLRRDDENRCTHLDRPSARCAVYTDRPRGCRAYSCEGDRRVWLDFAARVPNEKGIAAIFAHQSRRPLTLVQIRPTLPKPL